jgi:hypothetical protein
VTPVLHPGIPLAAAAALLIPLTAASPPAAAADAGPVGFAAVVTCPEESR